VDRIDEELRTAHSAEFAQVPRPKANVFIAKVPNAFVSPISVCLDYQVAFAKADGDKFSDTVDAGAPADAVSFSRRNDSFSLQRQGKSGDQAGAFTCAPSPLSKAEQLELLAWQLKPYPTCSFVVDGDSLTFAASCLGKIGATRPGDRAKRLIVAATSNQFTVLSPIIEMMSEYELVGVLAHELGHYYMSHTVVPSASYGMFYRLGSANPGKKPDADPDAGVMGQHLLSTLKSQISFSMYRPVEGQKLHSAMYRPLRKMSASLAASKSDPAGGETAINACVDFKNFFDDQDVKGTLKAFPMKNLKTDHEKEIYLRFESLALACAESTPTTGANQLAIMGEMIGSLMQEDFRLAKAVQPLPGTKTLAELVLTLSNDIIPKLQDAQQKTINSLFAEAAAKNLGWYTTEQEADDLAAEWLDGIGIDPKALIESSIKLAKLANEKSRRLQPGTVTGTVTGDYCEALYHNDWKNPDGKPAVVPVSNWGDVHHSGCFRAFNTAREIAIHNLTKHTTTPRPTPEGLPWDKLVQTLGRQADGQTGK